MIFVKIGITLLCVCVLFISAAYFMSLSNCPRWMVRADNLAKAAGSFMVIILTAFILYLLIGMWAGFLVIE